MVLIKSIKEIKQFGVYKEFKWNDSIPIFKRFNLIYGWNGTGKTTISRIFSSIEHKEVYEDYACDDGEFNLELDDKTKIKSKKLNESTLSIKVFNADFVKENIFFDDENKSCNPIIYISEEEIKAKKELEDLNQGLPSIIKDLEVIRTKLNSKEKEEDTFRTDVAKQIKLLLADRLTGTKYSSYNKTSAKIKIESVGLNKLKIQSSENFERLKKIKESEVLPKLPNILEEVFKFCYEDFEIKKLSELYGIITPILSKKIVAETITKLKKDSKLNIWVKEGLKLHQDNNENNTCLFCNNPITGDLISKLSKHFSEDYEEIQQTIKKVIDLINLIDIQFNLECDQFHIDLREEFKIINNKKIAFISESNDWLSNVKLKLTNKSNNPFDIIDLPNKPNKLDSDFLIILNKFNQLIALHNKKVENHETEIEESKEELEIHLLAEAVKEQKYSNILTEIKMLKLYQEKKKDIVDDKKSRIEELDKITSDTGKAINEINEYLEKTLGSKEIQLSLNSSTKQYSIQRSGVVATNLSEGEKTAIAFAYFLTRLYEKNFELKNSIIFIDDPISSFDSGKIYHCYSLIKNLFNDVNQLFISTHSFEFFNLMKYWFIQKNSKVSKKNKLEEDITKHKALPSEFYMVNKRLIDENKFNGNIEELDKTLKKFNSEYHYLFFLLNQFIKKEDKEYSDYYLISNIGRRFLEAFLGFKIPHTGDIKSKLDSLSIEGINSVDKDKIYKLINENSHHDSGHNALEHKDESECTTAVQLILDLVEKIDLEHYKILLKQIN